MVMSCSCHAHVHVQLYDMHSLMLLVNLTNLDGETALHWAVDWNQPVAVHTLLEAHVDVNRLDTHQQTAAHKIHAQCQTDTK